MRISAITARLVSALLLLAAVNGQSSNGAMGRFEMYCDGVGLFLTKVDGAPAPRKLLLFVYTGFQVSPMLRGRSGRTSRRIAMGAPRTESAKFWRTEEFG
jgi:hypothetical protein